MLEGDGVRFSAQDAEGIWVPHDDTLVIAPKIANHRVHQVMIDEGCSVNVIYSSCLQKIGIQKEELQISRTTMVGFYGERCEYEGRITLLVAVEDDRSGKTTRIEFQVLRLPSPNNCKGKDQLDKEVKDPADSDMATIALGPQLAEDLNHGQSTILIDLPAATASYTADEGLKLLSHQLIHHGGAPKGSQTSQPMHSQHMHSQPPSQPVGQLACKAQVVSKLSTFKAQSVQGEGVNYSRLSPKSLGPQ